MIIFHLVYWSSVELDSPPLWTQTAPTVFFSPNSICCSSGHCVRPMAQRLSSAAVSSAAEWRRGEAVRLAASARRSASDREGATLCSDRQPARPACSRSNSSKASHQRSFSREEAARRVRGASLPGRCATHSCRHSGCRGQDLRSFTWRHCKRRSLYEPRFFKRTSRTSTTVSTARNNRAMSGIEPGKSKAGAVDLSPPGHVNRIRATAQNYNWQSVVKQGESE